jgi:hypothetical protein
VLAVSRSWICTVALAEAVRRTSAFLNPRASARYDLSADHCGHGAVRSSSHRRFAAVAPAVSSTSVSLHTDAVVLAKLHPPRR